MPPKDHSRIYLLLLLFASGCARIFLAWKGGQYYWRDEGRFRVSLAAAEALRRGHWHEMFVRLFFPVEHTLYGVAGMVPALAVAGGAPSWIGAAYGGLFSTGIIYLVWRLSLATQGSPRVALVAAFLAAASTSLLYYSRHLVPYDISLCLILAGVLAGLGPRAGNFAGAGALIAAGFLVYNGYGLLAGTTLLAVIGAGGNDRVPCAQRAAWAGAGFCLVIGVVLGLEAAAGPDRLSAWWQFSSTVTAGDFAEGWSLPWEYFWVTERGLLLLWLIAFAAGGLLILRGEGKPLVLWAGIVLGTYGAMVILSVGLHRFVLYGRIARCLVPFLALLAGAVIGRWRELPGSRPVWAGIFAAGLGFQAALNFSPFLNQSYPIEFRREARRRIEHSPAGTRAWQRISTTLIFQSSQAGSVPATARVLWSRPHPLQLLPYQYEGYQATQRRYYREWGVPMKLVILDHEDAQRLAFTEAGPGHAPNPVRFDFDFAAVAPGSREALVAYPTGTNRAAVTVEISPSGKTFRVIVTRSGADPVPTAEYPLPPGQPHAWEVLLGPEMPPDHARLYTRWPQLQSLRDRLFLRMDGRVLLNRVTLLAPAPPGDREPAGQDREAAGTRVAFSPHLSHVEWINPLDLEDELTTEVLPEAPGSP